MSRMVKLSGLDTLPAIVFRNLALGGSIHALIFETTRAAQAEWARLKDLEHIECITITDALCKREGE